MDSKRDWGYAPEYCEGMWRILQQDTAEDFVLATGETHTIREFCELTFREIGVEIRWEGKGEKERGIVDSLKGLTSTPLGLTWDKVLAFSHFSDYRCCANLHLDYQKLFYFRNSCRAKSGIFIYSI